MTQNQPTELCVAPQLESPLSSARLALATQPSSLQPLLRNTEKIKLASNDDGFYERDNQNKNATPLGNVKHAPIVPEQIFPQHDTRYTADNSTALNEKDTIRSPHAELQNIVHKEINNTIITMGNRQSETKESGNETPDEQTPTCCSSPKRKSKDKSSKHLPKCRSEDTEFDVGEVYPFDTKCKDETEVVEPVDLEPFEIVETDDLSFIAGAGTSGVILSGTNGQYRISREIILEEKETNDASSNETETAEEGLPKTSDTHKDIKPNSAKQTESGINNDSIGIASITSKGKETSNIDEQEHIRVKKQNELSHSLVDKSTDRHSKTILLSQDMFSKVIGEKETCHIDSEAVDDVKPKGSNLKGTISDKENKTKTKTSDSEIKTDPRIRSLQNVNEPFDQLKTKTEDTVVYENMNATDVEKIIAKQAPIETIVPVKYILTQEMFKTKDLISNENEQEVKIGHAPLASMEDTDLSESNAEISNLSMITSCDKTSDVQTKELSRNNDIVNISNPTYGYNNDDDSIIIGTKDENIYETVDVRMNSSSDELGKNNQHERVSETNKLNPDVNHGKETDILVLGDQSCESVVENPDDGTKPSVDISDVSATEQINTDNAAKGFGFDDTPNERIPEQNKDPQSALGFLKAALLSKTDSLEVPSRDGSAAISREDTVPPPSPASMNVLTEENEDEDDETEHTKSNEMVDFGDVVCKRLSKLLEDKSFQDEETATTNVDQDSIIYFSPREFVDTSTGRYEMEDIEAFNDKRETKTENKGHTVSTIETNHVSSHEQKSPDGLSLSFESTHTRENEVEHLAIKRNDSAETLKRASGDSTKYVSQYSNSSSDDLPDFFDPENIHGKSKEGTATFQKEDSKLSLPLQDYEDTVTETTPNTSFVDDLTDVTPTAGVSGEFSALPELAKTVDKSVIQHEHPDQTTGRRSITATDSDLDISEQRTNISTDSMYADDEAEETMDILFTKTYTEPIEGAEVFLSCTVVNSAFKDEAKKRETWLSSDEALEYFEANASEVMSTAFMKAKKEMKDIQICLQNLRKQMDNFHGNYDDISLPDLPKAVADSLSPDSIGVHRKAVTD